MNGVTVSVIVPVYNKAAYIGRCLRSILSQTFTDFEVILVDDGSTDDSMIVATRFSDVRIKTILQKNGGPGSARNSGIAASSAEICAFLDADDEWLPNYLDESLRLLEEDRSVAAVVSGYFEYPKGSSTEAYWQKRGISNETTRVTPQHSPLHLVAMVAYMSCWSTIARKKPLQHWGGFFEQDKCRYAEDSFLWLKVLLNEKVRFSTTPRVKFHREASALSNIRSGPRPIEPFLSNPELMRAACPPSLAPLLESFLAIRAFKTACMLGFWGDWRAAREIFTRFAEPEHWRLPLFFPALSLANPIGSTLARLVRRTYRTR